ncbi:MAG: aminotransferase class V-fold PLP-dependent enzyme [Bacteroidota bacterium]
MIYFDTASAGIISEKALDALNAFNSRMSKNPSLNSLEFRNNELVELRKAISHFSGCTEEEFAFIPNVSFGLNAFLMALREIDRVLFYDQEFNALKMPFDLRNYQVHTFKDIDGFHWDTEKVKELLIEKKAQLFIFSETQWLTGYRCEAEELCRFCKEQGILSIMDITQSLGSMSFSFKDSNADVVLCSNYKWMNAGFGSGIMWMKKHILERYQPLLAGYNSAAPDFDFENFEPSIKCYEPGHLNLHALLVLFESINEKLTLGVKNIENHNKNLVEQFIAGVKEMGYSLLGDSQKRSSIAVLRSKSGLKKFLEEQNIICQERNSCIRFGFHYHNTREEVQKCLEALNTFT